MCFFNDECVMNFFLIIDEFEVSNGSIFIFGCVGKVMKLDIGDGS